MTIVVEIPGPPQGKLRPRFTRKPIQTKSGVKYSFTPAATEAYEEEIRWRTALMMRTYKQKLIEGMVVLHVEAFFRPPKKLTKAQYALAMSYRLYPTRPPDGDNIIKIIQDGLRKILIHEDTQVVSTHCDKFYSEKPRVVFAVTQIGEDGLGGPTPRLGL